MPNTFFRHRFPHSLPSTYGLSIPFGVSLFFIPKRQWQTLCVLIFRNDILNGLTFPFPFAGWEASISYWNEIEQDFFEFINIALFFKCIPIDKHFMGECMQSWSSGERLETKIYAFYRSRPSLTLERLYEMETCFCCFFFTSLLHFIICCFYSSSSFFSWIQ